MIKPFGKKEKKTPASDAGEKGKKSPRPGFLAALKKKLFKGGGKNGEVKTEAAEAPEEELVPEKIELPPTPEELASGAKEKLEEILAAAGSEPRAAGTEESRKAARMLFDYFEDEKFKEYIDKAEITASDSSQSGNYRRLTALCVILPLALCLSGQPLAALIVEAIAVFSFVREFIYCRSGRNWYFEKHGMENVHAVIEPEEKAENTIIFTSHHDSAPELSKKESDSLHLVLAHYCLIIVFTAISLLAEIFNETLFSFNLPGAVLLIFLIILAATSFIYRNKALSPQNLHCLISGKNLKAEDNLISSCLLVELARYFCWKKQREKGMKNTRLIFASFDGKECGLKGSEHWFKTNAELFKNTNAKVINLETYSGGRLTLLTSDLNGHVSLSSSFAAFCAKDKVSVSESLPGFASCTDAASAVRAGLEAVTLVSSASEENLAEVISTAIAVAEERDGKQWYQLNL